MGFATEIPWVLTLVSAVVASAAGRPARMPAACRVALAGDVVQLSNPSFTFALNVADGLRAEWWENRLSGERIGLGAGPEVELDFGPRAGPAATPELAVVAVPGELSASKAEAVFELAGGHPDVRVRVAYCWDSAEPVLHKSVTIVCPNGLAEGVRLLNVRLGTYQTDAQLSGGEEVVYPESFRERAAAFGGLQGFPVYANRSYFLTLAHPAGWATQEAGQISLRQYPGARIVPGEPFKCMEAVYGVAKPRQARQAFLSHLRSRMRRVVRGHDHPYAIFEPFGGKTDGDFNETADYVLGMIDKVAEGRRDSDCAFDLLSMEFWVDYNGDLTGADPVRFPSGIAPVRDALRRIGMAPGLWIDSSICGWTIGGNPATHPSIMEDVYRHGFGNTTFCRATEPIRSMYTEGFRYHIRENGVRLCKFDNLRTVCNNSKHDHLPGVYSTEAIIDGVIECLQGLDDENPDVFLMGYWGYRSPWWLLYLDTFFETGVEMEAASPGDLPAPYARTGVTRKLDQGHVYAKDVPWLGTDSLGVWLSSWPWNSQVGTERWQDGFVMDICRGNMLAQPWSDTHFLNPPERRQMGEFIRLLKARPECFGNPRLIIGDPWQDQPYGYCCTDGHRAMLAINNFGWEDRLIRLRLNSAWGLPDGGRWDLYRWYPRPAQIDGGQTGFGATVALCFRPFEVALIEVVPHGLRPTLERDFDAEPLTIQFEEPSQPVPVAVAEPTQPDVVPDAAVWTPLEVIEATAAGGATLALQPDGSLLASGTVASPDTYRLHLRAGRTGLTALLLEALPDASLPGHGPGRAANGNFALTGLRATAAPVGRPGETTSVAFREAIADYQQEGYGGWPVAAALDADPASGWSIDPLEGLGHAALFRFSTPVGFPGGTELLVEMDQGEREHSLGRFRLSVTSQPTPELPKGYGPRPYVISGQVPGTRNGGLLVITGELSSDGRPAPITDVGARFSAQGTIGGQAAEFVPVLGQRTYPAPWQAWRLPIAAGAAATPFELQVTTTLGRTRDLRFSAHFVAE